MFEHSSRRCGEHSLLITAARPFVEWHAVFPHAAGTVSLIDRLAHTPQIVAIQATSHPLNGARKRTHQCARRRRTDLS
jgi:hypothetical protein